MTRDVVSVGEDADVADIADLLERKQIKRVPVVSDGRVVGIVSRADLVRLLAAYRSAGAATPDATDLELRRRILQALRDEPWGAAATLNVIVEGGIAKVWGYVGAPEVRNALRAVVENVPGVRGLELHLGTLPGWAWAD